MGNKDFSSTYQIRKGVTVIKEYKTRKSVQKYLIAHILPDYVFVCERRIYCDGSYIKIYYDKQFNPTNIFRYTYDKGFIDIKTNIYRDLLNKSRSIFYL